MLKIFWTFPFRSGYRYSLPVKTGELKQKVYPERSRRALSLTQLELIIKNE